jgi:hypothetical protein
VDLASVTGRFLALVAEWHDRHRAVRDRADAEAGASAQVLASLRSATWPRARLLPGT